MISTFQLWYIPDVAFTLLLKCFQAVHQHEKVGMSGLIHLCPNSDWERLLAVLCWKCLFTMKGFGNIQQTFHRVAQICAFVGIF